MRHDYGRGVMMNTSEIAKLYIERADDFRTVAGMTGSFMAWIGDHCLLEGIPEQSK